MHGCLIAPGGIRTNQPKKSTLTPAVGCGARGRCDGSAFQTNKEAPSDLCIRYMARVQHRCTAVQVRPSIPREAGTSIHSSEMLTVYSTCISIICNHSNFMTMYVCAMFKWCPPMRISGLSDPTAPTATGRMGTRLSGSDTTPMLSNRS